MINWLSQTGRNQEVTQAIQALSRFYKLTLSRNGLMNSIETELQHVSLYIRLQNMRYDNCVTFVMDVPDDEIVAPGYYFEKSPEYWTGWLLAYYQWMSGKTFAVIQKEVPVEKIRDLYHPYHEMDITQGVQKLREIAQQNRVESYLKLLRKRARLSQSQLAEETGIPVKTIQQYEQRRKDINKAQAEYVIKLSQVLCCKPQELMEINE